MSEEDPCAALAGRYRIDRETYLADLREAFAQQLAELEAMSARAAAALEAAPSAPGRERLIAFRDGVERVRRESDALAGRVPDPLSVELVLAADGSFEMEVRLGTGRDTCRGTWSVVAGAVVLGHAPSPDRPDNTPVTESLAIRDGRLEKRLSAGHFPLSLHRA